MTQPATFMGHVLPTWIGSGIDRETGMLAGSIEVSGERMRAWLPAGIGAVELTPDDLMAGLPGAAPAFIGVDPASPDGDRDALVVRQGDRFVMATSDPKEIAAILAEAGGEEDGIPF